MVDLLITSITLTNGNSLVQIDPVTQRGMLSWIVNGTDQLNQQWFWLSEDSSAPPVSFDALGIPLGLSYSSTNAIINYRWQGLSVTLGFTLDGGMPGSYASDISENLTIQNLTGSPINLHLYHYSDFDLAGTADDDTVSFPAANTVVQRGKGMMATETVQTPIPSFWEASWYAITFDKLAGNSSVTLSDSLNPSGPGDQTFAYQWDLAVGVGQTVVITSVDSIRPVPVQLNIAPSGSNVILSWPTNSFGSLQLQSSSLLGAESNWTAITNLPAVANSQYQVTVPHTGSAQFYRLRE
jgi:hypothetical protein